MSKSKKIVYWIATIWLAAGMVGSGMLQLTKQNAEGSVSPPGVEGIGLMGYPVYFLTIIGIWKILGAIAILIPRYPLLKEWAYAGFIFLTTGAIYSHVALAHSASEIFPATLLLVLTVISWYTRPTSRKMAVAM